MKKYNCLVFPCGTEIANEIISSLYNHKYFKLLYASSEKISYCNYREKEVSILPYVTDNNFLKKFKQFILEKKIDFIIPAHDDVAFELSKYEELNSMIIGQSRKVNEIVRFKDKTYEVFSEIIPVPKVYKEEKDIVFPIFVKPKKGQGSQNSFLINDIEEFNYFKSKFNYFDFVWTEFLTGEEFTIDCFSHYGKLIYCGARTREKTTRGISVLSSFVEDDKLQKEFRKYAKKISEKLKLHGLWFFQMKYDKDNNLKLLEIAPRVSGTMMLNRVRGINFVELAIYQKLGFNVEVIFNNIKPSLARALIPKYKINIKYENLYIDFDDTLYLDNRYINSDLMKLIFQEKNKNKKIYLITKNEKYNLTKVLHKFGITNVFDDIIHISNNDEKTKYMKKNSVLIDDSFVERKKAIESGFYAFSIDNFYVLFE